MRSYSSISAAGLLLPLLLVLGLGSESVLGATSHTRSSFTRKKLLRRQQQASRSQIRINKNNEFEVDTPKVVHPNKYESLNASMHELNGTAISFGEEEKGLNEMIPVVVADENGVTMDSRAGRTSSPTSRPINPLIIDEVRQYENGTLLPFSDDIQEFHIAPSDSENAPSLASDVAPRPRTFFVVNQPILPRQHTHNGRRDQIQRFFEAAKTANQGDPQARATWEGQPSRYAPKTPFQPEMNVTKDYSDIISKSLWFYQVQRSGLLMKDGPRPVNWRNDSGLKDGFDNKIDLSGGYYDAGDYLKFLLPLR